MGYHVRVKICGITRADDLARTCAAGADAVGLNFAPGSPRRLEPAQAAELLRDLPPFVTPVGVFVGQRFDTLREHLVRLDRLRVVQVHGAAPEVIDASPWHYVPAFQVRDAADLARVTAYLDACRLAGRLPGAVLIDGHAPGMTGGTGVQAPWQLLAEFRPEVPVILAGGLTPDNIAEAVRLVRPRMVDVASGVESRPGVKDADKVRRFIDAARSAAAEG